MKLSPLAPWRDAVRDSDLDTNAKALAWCLSTYMGSDGRAFPEQQLLAAGCSLSVGTVHRATVTLEAAGFLKGRLVTRTLVAPLPRDVPRQLATSRPLRC